MIRLFRFCLSSLLFLIIFCSSPFLRAETDSSPDAPPLAPGEITRANFDLSADTLENRGVRVGRVTRRGQLPGGPWATGDIGDYLLENEQICVIVRGKDRPTLGDGIPGAGHIVDIAFRNQMWDSFAGLGQMARIEDKQYEARYNHIAIKPPPRPELPPVLEAYGILAGQRDVLVVTSIYLEPHASSVVVDTQYWNNTQEELTLDLMDSVGWGTLSVFVGGYGIPRYTRSVRLASHWVCGFLDDFGVGIVNIDPAPMDITPTLFNQSSLRYATRTLKPGERTRVLRTLILTRNDMKPVAHFALDAKKIDYGWLEGVITQDSDGQPVAGEEVRITRVRQGDDTSYRQPPYAITRTDDAGAFKFPLPTGEYAVRFRSPGRPLMPAIQEGIWIYKEETTAKNFRQVDAHHFVFEVVDADTGEPLPAKVRFEPFGGTRPVDFGPSWKAQGARDVFYLKPGPNAVPLVGGNFKCTFSRGPEYDIVEKEVRLIFGQPQTVRAELKRVVPTPNQIPADFNLATSASPSSRISAEDLVLSAAGEGLEWIFSGDLGQATDLNRAIRSLGLEKWIRASAGVHLSYQHRRLFGDFYVFPVPSDTTPAQLAALAGPETTPAQFFEAVRRTFPDALISVMAPALSNQSYLNFYQMDPVNEILPEDADFSLDFDALEVFESKGTAPSLQAWKQMEFLMSKGHFKIPLATSRPGALYYEEPGYPRTYLVLDTDDARAVEERAVSQALREGRYFITNGPIIEHSINGKWPSRILSPPDGRFVHHLKISAAPWVKVDRYAVKEFKEGSVFLGQMRPRETIVRFSTENLDRPWEWALYSLKEPSKELVYRDTTLHVQVDGLRLSPVVTGKGEEGYQVFAITPPVLLDGSGDGKVQLR